MSDRKEVIEKFARKANLSRAGAGAYLAILLEVIQLILTRTGRLKLPGFGNFRANAAPERKGVNPFTKKNITFARGVRVSFRPGRPLKNAVMNGSFLAKAAGKQGSSPAKTAPVKKAASAKSR